MIKFSETVLRIECQLARFKGVITLSNRDLSAYDRRYTQGWQIPDISGSPDHNLRLLINARFPYSPMRIAVSPAPPILSWPHLEEHGLLCLRSEQGKHSIDLQIENDIIHRLGEANVLVQESIRKQNLQDFEDEFQNYWAHWDRKTDLFFSLCQPETPSRWISSWHGKDIRLMAEEDKSLLKWMENRYGRETSTKIQPQRIPFIWLPRALRPDEFPYNVNALLTILDKMGVDQKMILQLIKDESLTYKSVLLGFTGKYGASLAGVRINALAKSIQKGFRGLPPPDVLMSRYKGAAISGAEVIRVDGPWVHGRDHNPLESDLSKKSAIIFGIGSIGSAVSELLIKSGIGRLALVDPENLSSENISRHSLGASAIGKNKAVELSRELSRQYPHREIEGHPTTLEDFVVDIPDALKKVDIIISTIGSWRAESWLNALALASKSFPPVLYGWTEEYAAAGHAAVLFHGQGCLRCLTNDIGQIRVPVTQWEADTSLQVPACGAQFQPYGAVELSFIHALISGLVLDVLLRRVTKSYRQVWIGQDKFLAGKVKGKWNPDWTALHGDPHSGGILSGLSISSDPSCPQCGESR